MVVFGVLLGLVILVILVVLHELGHAIAARRNGVVVEEFGIGFPPRAWKKQLKNGILFTLNWLPLGGFVRLKGEHDSARGEGTYGAASFWVKTKILLAGVLINWITAAALFMVLALVGLPKILPHQVVLPFDNTVKTTPLLIARVNDNSPAAKAGLKPKDQITAINKQPITTASDLSATTKSLAGQTVSIDYTRSGVPAVAQATINTDEQASGVGYLGVGSQQSETIHATWSAPVLGVATAGQLTYETVKGVGQIIVRGIGGLVGQWFGSDDQKQAAKADLAFVGDSLAGPVGILGVLFPAVLESGLISIILLAALISLTLAVMNILPIPALDGGRWFTMALFRLIKKPLTREREETIQATGFLVLIGLTILVTYNDIAKLF